MGGREGPQAEAHGDDPEPNSPAACGSQGGSQRGFLDCSSVRGHRSEIMLGVLVVVLGRDHIAGQGLRPG